jgi:hypothetical protein
LGQALNNRPENLEQKARVLRIIAYSLSSVACGILAIVAFQSFLVFRAAHESPSNVISESEMMRNYNENRLQHDVQSDFLEDIVTAEKVDASTIAMPQNMRTSQLSVASDVADVVPVDDNMEATDPSVIAIIANWPSPLLYTDINLHNGHSSDSD